MALTTQDKQDIKTIVKEQIVASEARTDGKFEQLAQIVAKGFASVDLRFDTVESDVAELKSDVAELKTDVAGLKSDVAELKTDVVGLKSDVKELKYDMKEVKFKVAETVHRSEYNDLRFRVENLERNATG